MFLTDLGLLTVWGFGVWAVMQQRITVGVLTVFVTCIGRFYNRLDSMSRMAAATQKAAASASRLFEILDQKAEVPEPENPVKIQGIIGQIDLVGASFSYGERAILNNVSLTIKPGEMIGLVGPSGAGKTTLVNLVCRFYDASSGVVKIDGHDVRLSALVICDSTSDLFFRSHFCSSGRLPRTSHTDARMRSGRDRSGSKGRSLS